MSAVWDVLRGTKEIPTITLKAYKDSEFKTEAGQKLALPYDATTLKVNTTFDTCSAQSMGGRAVEKYVRTQTGDLEVTFLLDDTTFGTMTAFAIKKYKGEVSDSVDELVNKFTKLAATVDEDTQSIYYIQITSSGMPLVQDPKGAYLGVLKSMNVKAEIVDEKGQRIKARLECVFSYADGT